MSNEEPVDAPRAELNLADAGVPDEPAVGHVVVFRALFGNGQTYDYASLRATNGLWYTTGRHAAQGVEWGELIAALRGHGVRACYVASQWDEVVL